MTKKWITKETALRLFCHANASAFARNYGHIFILRAKPEVSQKILRIMKSKKEIFRYRLSMTKNADVQKYLNISVSTKTSIRQSRSVIVIASERSERGNLYSFFVDCHDSTLRAESHNDRRVWIATLASLARNDE